MIHLPLSLALIKGWIAAGVVVNLALLAVGEATGDRTLIVISIISSATTLLVALISGIFSYLNSRKLAVVDSEVKKVSGLPDKVEELRKNTDGIMLKLEASRMETSEAKQEVARAEGGEKERVEERERQAQLPSAAPDNPLKMEIVNKKTNPVPTIPGEDH